MKLYDTLVGDAARNYCKTMLKMDPVKWDMDSIARLEVYGTDLTDPGEDYCEYRVINSEDKVIAVKREMGY